MLIQFLKTFAIMVAGTAVFALIFAGLIFGLGAFREFLEGTLGLSRNQAILAGLAGLLVGSCAVLAAIFTWVK